MDCKRCQKSQMKVNYKKGLWSPEEDQRLSDYVLKHGHGCWTTVPINAGLQRNGKSCRLRWINYLRPGLKHGFFTPEEDQTILNLHAKLGNKWSQIAMHLQGRTDNEVKNYWHTYLKKKLVKDKESEPSSSATSSLGMVLNELENHSSLLDSLQPMPPQKPYPKILFEEWLNDDHANSQSLENPNGLMMGNNTCMDHGSSTSRILHGFGDCDNLGAFGIQFHTSAEEALGGDSFGPFFMDEFFSNVNLNQDVQFDL